MLGCNLLCAGEKYCCKVTHKVSEGVFSSDGQLRANDFTKDPFLNFILFLGLSPGVLVSLYVGEVT